MKEQKRTQTAYVIYVISLRRRQQWKTALKKGDEYACKKLNCQLYFIMLFMYVKCVGRRLRSVERHLLKLSTNTLPIQ